MWRQKGLYRLHSAEQRYQITKCSHPEHSGPRTKTNTQALLFLVQDLNETFDNLPLTLTVLERGSITTVEAIYRPLRTMFDLKNTPVSFCELFADVTKNMREYVFIYIDDCMIFSADKCSHI